MTTPNKQGGVRERILAGAALTCMLVTTGCSAGTPENPSSLDAREPSSPQQVVSIDACSYVKERYKQVNRGVEGSDLTPNILSLNSFNSPLDLYHTAWMSALLNSGIGSFKGVEGEDLKEFDQKTARAILEQRGIDHIDEGTNWEQLVYVISIGSPSLPHTDAAAREVAKKYLPVEGPEYAEGQGRQYLNWLRLMTATGAKDNFSPQDEFIEIFGHMTKNEVPDPYLLESIALLVAEYNITPTPSQNSEIESEFETVLKEGYELDSMQLLSEGVRAGFGRTIREIFDVDRMDEVQAFGNGWYGYLNSTVPDPQLTYQINVVSGLRGEGLDLTAGHSSNGGWVVPRAASPADLSVWHQALTRCQLDASSVELDMMRIEEDELSQIVRTGLTPYPAAYILNLRKDVPSYAPRVDMKRQYHEAVHGGGYFQAARIIRSAELLGAAIDTWDSVPTISGKVTGQDWLGLAALKDLGKFDEKLPSLKEEWMTPTGVSSSDTSASADFYLTSSVSSLNGAHLNIDDFTQEGLICQEEVINETCNASMMAMGSYVLESSRPSQLIWW